MGTVATVKEFALPDLGEGLTEAEILDWRVNVGDTVTVDQAVAEVETAKAAVEVPCPYSGTVTALHGAPGEAIAVGAPLISIDTAAPGTTAGSGGPGASCQKPGDRRGTAAAATAPPRGRPGPARSSWDTARVRGGGAIAAGDAPSRRAGLRQRRLRLRPRHPFPRVDSDARLWFHRWSGGWPESTASMSRR